MEALVHIQIKRLARGGFWKLKPHPSLYEFPESKIKVQQQNFERPICFQNQVSNNIRELVDASYSLYLFC